MLERGYGWEWVRDLFSSVSSQKHWPLLLTPTLPLGVDVGVSEVQTQ